jgi:hypothetical protein
MTDMIFTNTLTAEKVEGGKFSISANSGIRGLSIKWVSGTVLYKGSMSLGGLSSDWLQLTDGSPYSFSSNLAVNVFEIDVTNGVCEISAIK